MPHEGHHETHTYAAGSPVTDGKRLYVSFGSQGVYCYDLDGKLLWQRHLGRMETRRGWGEGTSPVVSGGLLFHTWDHEAGSFLIALQADSGQTAWKVDRDEVTTWATPLAVAYKGKTQLIVPATKKIRSYDASNGKVLWECGGMTVNCIPSPVARDGVVYCMSGYQGAAAVAIPLDSRGDVTGKVLWQINRGTPYVPSPLLAGDRLYFTERNDPVLSCINVKTGKVVFDKTRMNALHTLYGSPVAAAGAFISRIEREPRWSSRKETSFKSWPSTVWTSPSTPRRPSSARNCSSAATSMYTASRRSEPSCRSKRQPSRRRDAREQQAKPQAEDRTTLAAWHGPG